MTTKPTLILGDYFTAELPQPIDIVITDVPYAMDKDGNMLGHLSPNYREKATHMRGYIDNDRAVYGAFLDKFFASAKSQLPSNGLLLSFMGNRTADQLLSAGVEAGFTLMDVLVFTGGNSFAKSTTTLAPRHELCAFFRKEGSPKRKINPDWKRTNLFHAAKTPNSKVHPTGKPVSWMEYLIETFTDPEDVVLDPFAGSGTTLYAARNLGRSSVGFEKDPEYYAEAERILWQNQH